jgi:hypothetical protein
VKGADSNRRELRVVRADRARACVGTRDAGRATVVGEGRRGRQRHGRRRAGPDGHIALVESRFAGDQGTRDGDGVRFVYMAITNAPAATAMTTGPALFIWFPPEWRPYASPKPAHHSSNVGFHLHPSVESRRRVPW